MKFITKEQELIGKTIKFIDLENYNASIIVTEGNGILISDFESDYDSYSTEAKILNEIELAEYILDYSTVAEALIKNQVTTEEEIVQLFDERVARRDREQEAYRLRQLESKRRQYEMLKAELGE